MEFAFTEEQQRFRDSIARFCRDKAPTATVRTIVESGAGFDRQAWAQICRELGLVGLHVAEDRGGLGFGPVELGIVMEEFGRSLIPVPYLSSVLASTALALVEPGAASGSLMSTVIGGDTLATLALDPRHGYPVSGDVALRDGRLHGQAHAVLDGKVADMVLVIVLDDGAPVLCAVDGSASGFGRETLRTMDATRPMARLTFDGCEAAMLGVLDRDRIELLYDTMLVALANEMVGGAKVLLDSTLEYTKMRVQFGRPIGSFQAIKHRLADLHTDVELARVAAYQAAQALASDEQPSANASLAKSVASDTYMTAAREAIQLRGGIGFTWENDTHLWYRRAKSSEVFLGTPAFHRERMLREMSE